jgi:hypothetical protein
VKRRYHFGNVRTWDSSIKMNFKGIWYDGVYWIKVAQDRVQWQAILNVVMTL